MTLSAAIVRVLTTTPGMNVREVHAALGAARTYNAVASQLSWMSRAGKLRRDPGPARGGRYWLTDAATVDRRRKALQPAPAKQAKPAYKPTDAQQPRVRGSAAKQKPAAHPAGTRPLETVDDFIARGGRVDVLPSLLGTGQGLANCRPTVQRRGGHTSS